eukprot:6297347-Prymnesium_polylepis.1
MASASRVPRSYWCVASGLSKAVLPDPSYSRCGSLLRLVGPGEVRLHTALQVLQVRSPLLRAACVGTPTTRTTLYHCEILARSPTPKKAVGEGAARALDHRSSSWVAALVQLLVRCLGRANRLVQR